MTEKELDVYTFWEAPNGNTFLKITENYSLALGPINFQDPLPQDLRSTQYVAVGDCRAKKIGKLILNDDKDYPGLLMLKLNEK